MLPAQGGEEDEGKDGGAGNRKRSLANTSQHGIVTGPRLWAHILAPLDYRLYDTEDKPPSPPRLLSSSIRPG